MIEILTISFLVALTGALSPGPVLTFTIYKSLESKKGYLAGLLIILGHAVLEFNLIIILLLGASLLFQNLIFLIIMGIVGGGCLITFGSLTIKNVIKKQYMVNFDIDNQNMKNFKGNSFLGGIFYSITNPYWTFWWAVIGLGMMINFNIGFHNPLGILLFFLGHELGDFVWYVPISLFVFFGGRSLNQKIYKYVLIGSGAFMIIFGVYLTLNILIFPPII
ncbi:MAG: lysine transporter LysE [Promethearchaeota archaeon Loki_b32]|nr:MAG: lysine transporter LysE [Candidatus Lokiarchaeota archaeon Loki_b32]